MAAGTIHKARSAPKGGERALNKGFMVRPVQGTARGPRT